MNYVLLSALALSSSVVIASSVTPKSNEDQAVANYAYAWMSTKCDVLLLQLEKEMTPNEFEIADLNSSINIPLDELPPAYQEYLTAKTAIVQVYVKMLPYDGKMNDAERGALQNQMSQLMDACDKLYAVEKERMSSSMRTMMMQLGPELAAATQLGDTPSKEEIAKAQELLRSFSARLKSQIKPLPKVDMTERIKEMTAMERISLEFLLLGFKDTAKQLEKSSDIKFVSFLSRAQKGEISLEALPEEMRAFIMDTSSDEAAFEKSEIAKKLNFYQALTLFKLLTVDPRVIELYTTSIAYDKDDHEKKAKLIEHANLVIKAMESQLFKLKK